MKPFASLLPLVLASFPAPAAHPDHWPAFRGANAAGVSATATPPVDIGPTKNVLWKVQVPHAPSSPSVISDRLFVTAFDQGELQVRAYQTSDGQLLWTRGVRPPKLEEFHGTEGSPAASTPATDGRHVVTYFGSHGLLCHDINGRELWQQPLPMAMTAGNFGSGTSPMIFGDRVVLNRDMSANSSIAAYQIQTGKKIWETPRPDSPTSYGTPILWNLDGRDQVVASGALWLKGYDLKSGEELWKLPGLPSYTCTTPVIGDGMLYFAGWSPGKADSPWPSWANVLEKHDANGDGHVTLAEYKDGEVWFKSQDVDRDGKLTQQDWDYIGGLMKKGENALIALKPPGRGEVPDTKVAWKFARGLPYVPSPLYYEGKVYLIRDGGMMSCFDAKTGEPLYTQERIKALGSYYASPVAGNGKIYVASLDGTLSVIRAGGKEPEILHQVKFGEKIAASPALSGRRLYLRTQGQIYAFEAKAITAAEIPKPEL